MQRLMCRTGMQRVARIRGLSSCDLCHCRVALLAGAPRKEDDRCRIPDGAGLWMVRGDLHLAWGRRAA
jgi:hypothetical protein